MKNLMTVLAVALVLITNAQSRIFDSYTTVAEEYPEYQKMYEGVTVKFVDATDELAAYYFLTDTDADKSIIQYFTDGRSENSVVYSTLVVILESNKTSLIQQIQAIDKNYYKLNDHNWYSFQKGFTIEVNWEYNAEANANIFLFSLKEDK